ncbi:hypothetical protein ASG19_04550 [Rhizobium sp. Leaf306]|uniref:hypothetical protein n=1 Tax=Rhizobium sp. Leaf306 TaxID=1736330 RepID=UPI000713EB4D|nr:hypothetical protein [Rhizobium sp. Leaf306]KQQ38328.1 hypothetical protein ASG19_04550 [Rhizobium sp. Leaf306]
MSNLDDPSKPARKAFDLTEAVEHLPELHQQQFVKAVLRYHAVVSVSLDLKSTHATLEAFHHQQKNRSDPYRSQIGAALLTSAVVTYARATHTKAITRFKVGIEKCYSPEQKLVHDSIVELRNRCLAHFGPGEDRWHDERVIYLDSPLGIAVTSVHHRTNFDLDVIAGLSDLLETAIPYARLLEAERASELSIQIHLISTDARDVVRAHEFDIAKFFNKSQEAIKGFWRDTGFAEELQF